MTAEDFRLQCLSLAMAQAKNENSHGDINRVVEISLQFYNHIVGTEAEPEPEKVEGKRKPGRPSKADKADLFH